MAKRKSYESEHKSSGSKKLNSNMRVCMDENMETKVKKKRKKNETEESTVPAPAIQITEGMMSKKHQQQAENVQKKKTKNKKSEIPALTQVPASLEDDDDDGNEREEVMKGEEDLSPEERRVLERKMKKILKKKQKDQLKAEGKTEDIDEASKPIAPQQALDYLSCWAENRKDWRFQKTRQTWLLQHMFDSKKIPDENFTVLLSYLEGVRGRARDTTVQKAETLVREEEGEQDTEAQQRVKRAREVIQLLS
ncbi:uncharacterized protein C7orf50 [Esox lucius]|uniref:uncharacterized protein C7orf50 n=1 Tax=Esox lucius TaxID=8010 RepID=UPI0014776AAE|nr:uncharacterized protein C7orf50 [Esox lucius]